MDDIPVSTIGWVNQTEFCEANDHLQLPVCTVMSLNKIDYCLLLLNLLLQ